MIKAIFLETVNQNSQANNILIQFEIYVLRHTLECYKRKKKEEKNKITDPSQLSHM